MPIRFLEAGTPLEVNVPTSRHRFLECRYRQLGHSGRRRSAAEWGRRSVFHSQCIDPQAARCDSLVAVEAGVGRRSGINHGEIGSELEEPIIPGLNCRVNNTRVKFEPWCFCDWHIGTVRASLSCSTLPKWINSMRQFGQRPPGDSASPVSQCVRAVLPTPLCPTKPMCGLQRHETGQP